MDPPGPQPASAVIAVCSNKGGVGKTTVATNLAVYLRALHEDLPVLVLGLDDQSGIDRMFAIDAPDAAAGNLKHAWAERSLDRVVRLGQYGIHYVPTPPDTSALKERAADPGTLRRILERTDFEGVTILDTKSDLEALTRNALHAADLVLLPVADLASLEEAEKVFRLAERPDGPRARLRVLLTLVDRRTRVDGRGGDLVDRLEAALRERGRPRFATRLARSPRVEALNSATKTPGSILHHARGTRVHAEMRALAEEVSALLDLAPPERPAARATRPAAPAPAGLKAALLRGLGAAAAGRAGPGRIGGRR